MSDGGKGSKPRPYSVDNDTFANNWDRIFRNPDMSKIGDKVVQQVKETIEQRLIDDAKAEDEAFQEIQKKQDNPIK